jgi:hypothetical protein
LGRKHLRTLLSELRKKEISSCWFRARENHAYDGMLIARSQTLNKSNDQKFPSAKALLTNESHCKNSLSRYPAISLPIQRPSLKVPLSISWILVNILLQKQRNL